VKYVIFDIDGTLTDTTEVDDKCYMDSFESLFGINIKDTNWNSLKNVTDWGITEELFKIRLDREVTIQEIQLLKETFVNDLESELAKDKSQFIEINGAANFFHNLLINEALQIGIATGGWEESADLKLKAIGINPHQIIYSNSSHFKSRERITRAVIEQLNKSSKINPDEIIYLGDGEWDYRTCQKLGIRFIGIDNKRKGKLEKLGANEIYPDFKDSDLILNSILNI